MSSSSAVSERDDTLWISVFRFLEAGSASDLLELPTELPSHYKVIFEPSHQMICSYIARKSLSSTIQRLVFPSR